MLLGVAFLPPSLIPALRNKGILHRKKAKLPKHFQHSAYLKNKEKVRIMTNEAVF